MEGRFPFSPKFRKFRLEMERTSSVLTDWNISLGTPLKVVNFERSGHFGRSDRIVPFHFDKIVFPTTALLYPPYKDNNQTRGGLGRVCTNGMYRSIGHLGTYRIFVEWKAPEMSNFDSPLTYQVRLGNAPSLDPSKRKFLSFVWPSWLQPLLKRHKFFAKVKIRHQTSHLISPNKKVIFLADFLVHASFLSLRIQPFLLASRL